MDNQLQHTEDLHETPLAVNPKKFLLWLFIATIVMFFAAMTSAYLVRSTDGDWLKFDLPPIFTIGTGVILLSSVTVQAAYWFAKSDNKQGLVIALSATILLGVLFMYLQYVGCFGKLFEAGVFMGGAYSNPAGSFVYVLAFAHGFHLITGLIYLLIVLYSSSRGSVHSGKLLQIEMCTTYWHFLDLLWIYLFVFLQVNN